MQNHSRSIDKLHGKHSFLRAAFESPLVMVLYFHFLCLLFWVVDAQKIALKKTATRGIDNYMRS